MRQKSPETYDEKLAQLQELRAAAAHSAPEAEEKQHAKGKYTARERVEKLLDAAKVEKYRTGDNPARWRGHLRNLLPATSRLSITRPCPIPRSAPS